MGGSFSEYGKKQLKDPTFNVARPSDAGVIPSKGEVTLKGYKGDASFSNAKGNTIFSAGNVPPFNFAPCNVDTSSVNKAANTANTIGMVLAGVTGLGALAGVGMSIFNAVKGDKEAEKANNGGLTNKENKAVEKKTQDSSGTVDIISSIIEDANKYDENSSIDAMMTTSKTLKSSVESATRQKRQAVNNQAEAQRTLDIANPKLEKATAGKRAADQKITDLTDQLTNLKKTDRKNLSDAEKNTLNEKINAIENNLEAAKKESESFDKTISEQTSIVNKQTAIIERNKNTAEALDKKITEANTSMDALNAKINTHKDR